MEPTSQGLPFSMAEDERLEVAARANEAVLAITDRRMVVASPERTALDLPVEAIRRVQFDVERGRPATLVIVPHEPAHEPQVLSVPKGELEAAARAVFAIGYRLHDLDTVPERDATVEDRPMTDQPTERQPLPGPDPEKPDEPYTIEHQQPTDEDGQRIHPPDAPRRGDDQREPSVTGTIEEGEPAANLII